MRSRPADGFPDCKTPVETSTSPGLFEDNLTVQFILHLKFIFVKCLFKIFTFYFSLHLFISVRFPSLQITHLKFTLCFSSHIFLCDILSFVVQFFTFCKTDRDFYQTTSPVLQLNSFQSSFGVEPQPFTSDLLHRLRSLYTCLLYTSGNECDTIHQGNIISYKTLASKKWIQSYSCKKHSYKSCNKPLGK